MAGLLPQERVQQWTVEPVNREKFECLSMDSPRDLSESGLESESEADAADREEQRVELEADGTNVAEEFIIRDTFLVRRHIGWLTLASLPRAWTHFVLSQQFFCAARAIS